MNEKKARKFGTISKEMRKLIVELEIVATRLRKLDKYIKLGMVFAILGIFSFLFEKNILGFIFYAVAVICIIENPIHKALDKHLKIRYK